MNTEIVLSWKNTQNKIVYYLDTKEMGTGDAGFQQVINFVAKAKGISRLIISVPMAGATGGKPITAYLPFSNRYPELLASARSKQIGVELKFDHS